MRNISIAVVAGIIFIGWFFRSLEELNAWLRNAAAAAALHQALWWTGAAFAATAAYVRFTRASLNASMYAFLLLAWPCWWPLIEFAGKSDSWYGTAAFRWVLIGVLLLLAALTFYMSEDPPRALPASSGEQPATPADPPAP